MSVVGEPKVSWVLVWEEHGWIGIEGRHSAFRGVCCEGTAGCRQCNGAGHAAI